MLKRVLVKFEYRFPYPLCPPMGRPKGGFRKIQENRPQAGFGEETELTNKSNFQLLRIEKYSFRTCAHSRPEERSSQRDATSSFKVKSQGNALSIMLSACLSDVTSRVVY
jgi:hypothetical protein